MKSLLLLLVLAAGSPDELAKSLKDLFDDDLQDSPKPKAEEPQEPPRVKLVDPFADDLPKADPFAELERSEAHVDPFASGQAPKAEPTYPARELPALGSVAKKVDPFAEMEKPEPKQFSSEQNAKNADPFAELEKSEPKQFSSEQHAKNADPFAELEKSEPKQFSSEQHAKKADPFAELEKPEPKQFSSEQHAKKADPFAELEKPELKQFSSEQHAKKADPFAELEKPELKQFSSEQHAKKADPLAELEKPEPKQFSPKQHAKNADPFAELEKSLPKQFSSEQHAKNADPFAELEKPEPKQLRSEQHAKKADPFAELEKPEHAVQKGTPSPASPVLSSEHAKKTDPFGELDKMEERVQKVDPSELEKSAPAPEHVKRSAKPKAEVAPEQINVSDLSAKLEKLKSQESHATQAEVKVAKITAHPVSKLEQSNASPETLHVATSEPSRIPKAEVAPKFERSQVLPASHAAKEVSEPQIERAKKEPESMEFQLEELKTALQETRLELKMVRQVLANSDAEKEKANATANASLAASASAASASASASASAASASGFFARLKASIFAAPARPLHTAGVAGGAAGAAPSSMAAFWGPAKAAPTAEAPTAGGAAPLSASPVALVQRRMRGVDFTKSQSLEVPQVSISEPFRALEQQDQQEEQRLKDMYRHLRPQSGAAEAAESGQHFSAVWADLEEQDKNIQEALVDLDDPRRPLDLRQYQRLNAMQDASMSQLEGKA